MMVNGLKSKFKATNMGRAFLLNLQKNQKSKRAETKKQTKNSIPSFTEHTTRRRVIAHSVDLLHRGDVLLLQSGHFIIVVVVVVTPRGLWHTSSIAEMSSSSKVGISSSSSSSSSSS